jgi:hypothetical protein
MDQPSREAMAGKLQIYADRMELLRSVRGNLRDSWALDNESAERLRPEKIDIGPRQNLQRIAVNEF